MNSLVVFFNLFHHLLSRGEKGWWLVTLSSSVRGEGGGRERETEKRVCACD